MEYSEKWPIFLPSQILVLNPEANIGIVCGWAQRDRFYLKLVKRWQETVPKTAEHSDLRSCIAAIGNLYSPSRGIDIMVRNLLANPKIRRLIFTGPDLSGASHAAFRMFLQSPEIIHQDKYYKFNMRLVKNTENLTIHDNIPFDTLLKMLHDIVVYRAPKIDEVIRHLRLFQENPLEDDLNRRKAFVIPPPRIETPSAFPAPNSVHPIRVKTIGEGYLELLFRIMTYGHRIETHYGEPSKELLNLIVIISDQKPDLEARDLPKFVPFDLAHLDEYYPRLLTDYKEPDATYTYGSLIRSHFDVDQIQKVSEELARDPTSRSAVISLWDPKHEGGGSPCLNHIHFRIIENSLHMTATIRSNDMFFGWPENAYGLRKMQDTVRALICAHKGDFQDANRYSLGDLTIVSQSAHIYERDWEPSLEIMKKYRRSREWWDESGQWIFESIENSPKIKASLAAPNGPIVRVIEGTPDEIRKIMTNDHMVSDIGHAIWIGFQLGKF